MSYGAPSKFPFKFSFKKFIVVAMIALVLALVGGISWNASRSVPAGYVGVLLNWGQPIGTLDAGFHWISPVGQEIQLVNIQIQKVEAQETAASSDLQEVSTSVAVNYQIDQAFAKEVYTNLRDQYESRVIIPAMQDGLKAVTPRFQAGELVTRREEAKNAFQDLLQQKLQQYHIVIVSVSITNFKFSDQFQAAIDAKVTTEQTALAAQNQLAVVQFQAQQQVINASAAANATITKAIGDANATVIRANAAAESILIIQAQLTPEYLQYLTILGWDGKLPIYWSANGSMPFILIPTTSATNTTLP
jgi:regulator of protease activity HflC (stomatin/prohibitin superfamily)